MNKEGLENTFDCPVRDGNANWKLPCPFHHEVTPSFLIHKESGFTHCFGCGWTGTVVDAVQQYSNVSKDKANQIVKRDLGFRLLDGVLNRRRSRRERQSIEVYPESYLQAWPQKVHKSILERGLTVETLRDAESRYDVRSARQVFPHRNQRGALLGVAGRTCRGDHPKWLFYWDYSKGQSLYYGTNKFVQAGGETVQHRGPLFVVEGIFDCLWLQQHGVPNTVAILGSKPSKAQIAQIRDLSNDVVLALDNDEAGSLGNKKLYHALRRSMNIRFLDWPDNVNDIVGEDVNLPLIGYQKWISLQKSRGFVTT